MDPYGAVPLLHSSTYVSGWSPRSPENPQQQQILQGPPPLSQDWPTSPSPSPTSPYQSHRIGCTSASLSSSSPSLYVVGGTPEPGPCTGIAPDQQQLQSTTWLHPTVSEQIQQHQQQQSYLNLNLHLHHQISYTVNELTLLLKSVYLNSPFIRSQISRKTY